MKGEGELRANRVVMRDRSEILDELRVDLEADVHTTRTQPVPDDTACQVTPLLYDETLSFVCALQPVGATWRINLTERPARTVVTVVGMNGHGR